MTYELEAFKIGLIGGYYLVCFLMLIIASIVLAYKYSKVFKYLFETKQLQKY